ncbi:hypothetical protein IC5_00627 [Bacillus cereus AND1407]|nr:hypothetical protein IC5_00627 [Bacillus cereus AND1407]KFL81396.1 hypothetical protein DJ51_1206 [Bacillus cereus]TDT85085.1 hypothetical protein DEU41_2571 [Bacillus sp. AG1163]
MGNEMMERVEQLEEKVKRLEGELARTTKAKKDKYCSGVRGRATVFNIWCGCSRANYRLCNHDSYWIC